jgi:peptidoglycan/LPS O-acetylase OafA/YrhL
MPRDHFGGLDGLRALAVVLVFCQHVDRPRFPGGFFGVELFFVISGFLITSLLVREWGRTGSLWFRGFYMRRALRLMPALAVVVAVVTPLAIAYNIGDPAIDATAALTYLTDLVAPLRGTTGGLFGHTWSLAVEEQFYLLWPTLLVFGLARRWPMAAVAGGIALLAVAATWTVSRGAAADDLDALYLTPLPHVPALLAGAVLAFVLAGPAAERAATALRPAAIGPVLLAGLALLALTTSHQAGWLYAGGLGLVDVGAAVLIGTVVVAPGASWRALLELAPVRWLGARSYGFYLWHAPIVWVLQRELAGVVPTAAAALVLALGATVLSWRLVEQPFLRLRGRYRASQFHIIGPSTPAVNRSRGTGPSPSALKSR